MKTDIFIHPDFPYLDPGISRELFKDFYSKLEKVVKNSENPVLVRGGEKGYIENLFSEDNSVESISYSVGHVGMSVYNGAVHPDYWHKFKSLIDGKDEIRIHGAFLGECTFENALQVFGLVKHSKHWRKYGGQTSSHKKQKEFQVLEEEVREGGFLKSNIKYGVILQPPKKIKILSGRTIIGTKGRKSPFGDAHYQLIDSDTKIFKYPLNPVLREMRNNRKS